MIADATKAAADNRAPIIVRERSNHTVIRLSRWTSWLLVIVVLVWLGLMLRAWAFRATTPIRFHGDIENAVNIGQRVVLGAMDKEPPAVGKRSPSWRGVLSSYLDTYDREVADAKKAGRTGDIGYRIDYPPGRLLLVSLWSKHVADEKGLLYRYDDDFAGPMLAVNTIHELLAAFGAGALVWQALRRSGAGELSAEALAVVAGALLWFNPAMILDAHGWPQWDAWVLPYTLWASFFALRDRWMATGALLAIGAMFKGQVLLMAPLFLLWPIFRLRIGAAMRVLIGFGVAFAICVSPWLIGKADRFVLAWTSGCIALSILLALWPRTRRFGLGWSLAVIAFAGWLALAAIGAGAIAFPLAIVAAVLFAGLSALSRRIAWPMTFAASALILFAAGGAFHGSFAWLPVGFQTDRYPVMHQGNTVNAAAILERFYAFGSDAPVTIDRWTISMRQVLRILAYIGIATASLGVALRDRSRDANVVVGFVAAWTILYALMPQMHERYLVWAAATSAVLAARSVGGLILHLALTALQFAMLLCSMIEASGKTNDPTFGTWHFVVRGLVPAAGWATITLAGVLLVWSFQKSRRPRRIHLPSY